MASLDAELLAAARLLIHRNPGERGRMARARVRRSISTAYYALFHFIIDEATCRIVGKTAAEARRRRILARSFPHDGLLRTLNKLSGQHVAADVADFVRRGEQDGPVLSPRFVRSLASVFAAAQSQRHDADYDLNTSLSENDARTLIARVERAIEQWRAARTDADRDIKHVLSVLLLMQGKLRT
ncbi:MAG: hypothetical protein JO290_06220 [Sphingomonadaceae bacterium]|nr:hypothetical protein [Sphingomonadaceae bacterium]